MEMNSTFIILVAYFIVSAIYGFGRISRGIWKDSITGLGILGIILVFIFSLFVLPIKQTFVYFGVWFLLLMPLSGLLMAWMETILFKSPLETRERISVRTGIFKNEKKTYLVGGIRKGIDEGKPYYGQGAKLLVETKEGWKIGLNGHFCW